MKFLESLKLYILLKFSTVAYFVVNIISIRDIWDSLALSIAQVV
jgi:hypothetical protein